MNADDFNQTKLLEWFVKLGSVNNWDFEIREGNSKRKYLELKTKFILDGTSDENKIVINDNPVFESDPWTAGVEDDPLIPEIPVVPLSANDIIVNF